MNGERLERFERSNAVERFERLERSEAIERIVKTGARNFC
jgi:hypothetical protein